MHNVKEITDRSSLTGDVEYLIQIDIDGFLNMNDTWLVVRWDQEYFVQTNTSDPIHIELSDVAKIYELL